MHERMEYSGTPRGFAERTGSSVYVILAAGFVSLIPPVYFLLLMSDARKLERRLQRRQTEYAEDARADEELLIANEGQPVQIPATDPESLSAGPN